MIKIRSLALNEYHQITYLRNQEKPFPYLTDVFTHVWDPTYDIVPRVIRGVEKDGELAGSAGYAMAEADPNLWFIGILLKPHYRQQGLGTQVYQKLLSKLRARKAERILTMAYDHQEAGQRFIGRHGFEEVGRSIIGQLDLATVDIEVWPDPDEMVGRHNLRFATLGNLPRRGVSGTPAADLESNPPRSAPSLALRSSPHPATGA